MQPQGYQRAGLDGFPDTSEALRLLRVLRIAVLVAQSFGCSWLYVRSSMTSKDQGFLTLKLHPLLSMYVHSVAEKIFFCHYPRYV